MIFAEASKTMYKYIMQIEVNFLTDLKLNPFELFSNVALLDFEAYIHGTYEHLKQSMQNVEKNRSNHIGKINI